MKKTLMALIAGCAVLVGVSSRAVCADIVGTVLDASGSAVSGAMVSITTQDGLNTGSAITDAQGNYAIDNISSGLYHITLAPPAGAGARGQAVASYVGDMGQTVNWAVAPGREAVAFAMPGITKANPDLSGVAVASDSKDSPPGCKGMPGPPCGPKKSKKNKDD